MVHLLRTLVSLLGFERCPFNTIDLRGRKDRRNTHLDGCETADDARQQMMSEVSFPRKRIQEKVISNFYLAQAMRSEGHCFRYNPYLFSCLACLLLCPPSNGLDLLPLQ
ncbi:hypothetical protein AMTRI_Chr02g257230 [Amborella trichopoda]